MSRQHYIAAPGELEVQDQDENGDVIGRTIYTPERYANERDNLPAAVVATYEGRKADPEKKAETTSPVAAKKKTAAKKAVAKKSTSRKTGK